MTLFDDFEFDMSDDAWSDEITTALPAILNQDDESNNQKLLKLIAGKANFWKNNKLKLHDNLSWLTAKGQSLTECAAEFGITRLDDDDEFLRFQIRLKVFERMYGATEQGTKQFIAKVFGVGVNDFNIVPGDHLEEIEITNLPFEFPDDDRKEEKQRIISQSIQDNLPPTFKLKDIVYVSTTDEHLYYGTYTETDVVNESHTSTKDLTYNTNTIEHLYYGTGTETTLVTYTKGDDN